MIGLVAGHESRRLLRSSQTWLVAAVLAGLAGYLFLRQLERWIGAQASIALQDHAPGLAGFLGTEFLAPFAVVLSIVAPLYAMRAFSDEFREHTWALWQSSPVPLVSLVLGKYAGIMVVLVALAGVAIALVASLATHVPLDAGVLASAATGLLLCTAASAATGLYCSSFTRQPFVGALSAIVILVFLWLLGSADFDTPALSGLKTLSPGEHLAGFVQGYPGTDDFLYFVLFIALFLALTVIRLDALRFTDERP